MFFTPWGHVNFHDHIWAFQRHLGHMTYMLDSDWLKKFLLRSDWLPTEVALCTTHVFCTLRNAGGGGFGQRAAAGI